MTTLAEWAQWYAGHGVPVFPLHHPVDGRCSCGDPTCPKDGPDGKCVCTHACCTSPAKHPRTKHGLTDASCDAATIDEWWRKWPTANIGVRTGIIFDALDVDGEPGRFALHGWLNGRELPPRPTSRTQSGGWHMLFQPTGGGNRARMVDHVDWRGRGGYIVAPPSVGLGGPYVWLRAVPNLLDIPAAPKWLHDLVVPPRPPQQAVHVRGPVDRTSRYGEAALRNILTRLADTGPGARNNALNEAAYACGQIIGAGLMDPGIATDALIHVGIRIGLSEKETRLTVNSGLAAGARNPRMVG